VLCYLILFIYIILCNIVIYFVIYTVFFAMYLGPQTQQLLYVSCSQMLYVNFEMYHVWNVTPLLVQIETALAVFSLSGGNR